MNIPSILYGTAWKEERTYELTRLALQTGFLGLDSANQRKHYFEAEVGRAFRDHLRETSQEREGFFVQSKFSFVSQQDHRLPYDPQSKYSEQVKASVLSSLKNFETNYLDSVLLHGPLRPIGLGEEEKEAWRALEALVDEKLTRTIGVSNFSRVQLEELLSWARVKPAFIQNRCFARRAWDRDIRQVCAAHSITYQGFSLLTANPEVLLGASVKTLAEKYGRTPQQIIFKFASQLEMLPLTGTSSAQHMKQDLDLKSFSLSGEDLNLLENLSV